jgi:hypothetical protein
MDELDQIKRLAGINEFKGYHAYDGSNISITGNEKQHRNGFNCGSLNRT